MLPSAALVDPFEGIDDSHADGEWDVDGGYLGPVRAVGQDAVGRDAVEQDVVGRDAVGRDAVERDVVWRDVGGRDAARQDVAPRMWPRRVPVADGNDTSGSDADSAGQETVEQLQTRIRQMQGTRLDTRDLPTHPAIASLLPGGGLKQGAAYSVERSATLLMALLAGPSAAGSWCGVVGVPEFGVEAASSYGIDLDRLVLVPHPGDQWLGVTAAIADVLTVVVTRPPRHASDGSVARLAARLRQRGSTLIVLGTWPQTEAMLSISRSRWSGIGDGFGHLASREVTVTVTSRTSGRPRSVDLLLPDDLRNAARRQESTQVVALPVAALPVAALPAAGPAAAAAPAAATTALPVTAAAAATPSEQRPMLHPLPVFEEAMAG